MHVIVIKKNSSSQKETSTTKNRCEFNIGAVMWVEKKNTKFH